MYYGFTRFAMELNELDSETIKFLPSTDTRFRPDQRALEEGDLDAAEEMKLTLEQKQREKRKRNEGEGIVLMPRWFRYNFNTRKTSGVLLSGCFFFSKRSLENGEEVWEYNGKYWEMRRNHGFTNLSFEPLW